MIKIILASKSRDRKKLFDNVGIKVDVIPSNFDERSINLEKGDFTKGIMKIALEKGKTVFYSLSDKTEYFNEDIIIISADTMVYFEGDIIGKANTIEHAFKILKKLAGNTHSLITAVSIIICKHYTPLLGNNIDTMEVISFMDESKITFIDLTDQEIGDYLKSSEEYKGRAGAYSLAERASFLISKIEGSPSNVIGLPMDKIYTHLKSIGLNLLT